MIKKDGYLVDETMNMLRKLSVIGRERTRIYEESYVDKGRSSGRDAWETPGRVKSTAVAYEGKMATKLKQIRARRVG